MGTRPTVSFFPGCSLLFSSLDKDSTSCLFSSVLAYTHSRKFVCAFFLVRRCNFFLNFIDFSCSVLMCFFSNSFSFCSLVSFPFILLVWVLRFVCVAFCIECICFSTFGGIKGYRGKGAGSGGSAGITATGTTRMFSGDSGVMSRIAFSAFPLALHFFWILSIFSVIALASVLVVSWC